MENKKILPENIKSLPFRFEAYCRKVIRNRAYYHIQKYMQYCRNYAAVSCDDVGEETLSVVDEYAIEKTEIRIGEERVMIGDTELADAIMELQERMRKVLLLNIALGHSLSEISVELGISYASVKVYKSMALKEIRKKVHRDE